MSRLLKRLQRDLVVGDRPPLDVLKEAVFGINDSKEAKEFFEFYTSYLEGSHQERGDADSSSVARRNIGCAIGYLFRSAIPFPRGRYHAWYDAVPKLDSVALKFIVA